MNEKQEIDKREETALIISIRFSLALSTAPAAPPATTVANGHAGAGHTSLQIEPGNLVEYFVKVHWISKQIKSGCL